MKNKCIVMTFGVLFFVACSPKTTVVLLDSGKRQNAILVANAGGTVKLDKVGTYVNVEEKKKTRVIHMMSKNEILNRFSDVLAISPLKPITYIVYFKPNSTELTESSKRTFQEALKAIEARSPCMVDIIGHTDTMGSSSINTKVSLKRAKAIEFLVRKTNIKILSLVSKGYGEEDLLVQTKNNKMEARNRNVEIFIK